MLPVLKKGKATFVSTSEAVVGMDQNDFRLDQNIGIVSNVYGLALPDKVMYMVGLFVVLEKGMSYYDEGVIIIKVVPVHKIRHGTLDEIIDVL